MLISIIANITHYVLYLDLFTDTSTCKHPCTLSDESGSFVLNTQVIWYDELVRCVI